MSRNRFFAAVFVATVAATQGFAAIHAAPASADGSPTAAPANVAADSVAKVQAFYDKTTTFKADFTQEFNAKLHNKKTSSKGVVTFSKPGKMYFEYAEPEGNRVVSDGTTLKVYEKGSSQMYEQVVDKSQYPAALSFLTGSGKLTDSFTFQQFDGDAMGFKGGVVLAGTPKQASPAYKTVFFYVDKDTWQVRRVLILDGQGNRNRFDFSKPRVNEPVSAELFKFTPPPGTTIVKP